MAGRFFTQWLGVGVNTMNADLLRQRRNLVVLSLVLLLFSISETTIGAKVSVLGTELVVGNPGVLKPLAWVFWFYFLLRYYQYWRAEPDSPIRDAFKAQRDKLILAAYPVERLCKQGESVRNARFILEHRGLLRSEVILQDRDPTRGISKNVATESVGRWAVFFWSIRSALHVAFNTRHATDHILPFALAVAAPLVTVYRALCPT